LPTFDFVAIGEHRILNARAIQERAVAALAVLDAATARPALHGKVHAGHKRVVRQSKLRAPRRPPESYGLPRDDGHFLPRHRPRRNFKYYAHSLEFAFPHFGATTHMLAEPASRFALHARLYKIESQGSRWT
jgi:hypothetical protein